MNIEQLRNLLKEYKNNRTKGLGLLQRCRFFFTQQDDRYMQLLQRFVVTKYNELSKQYNNDVNRVLEQDIPFDEFKDHLRNCNQLDSFESYLTAQSNLPYKDQRLIYRLIRAWLPKELLIEILTKIFENLSIQDLLKIRLTCSDFKRISDNIITSRYPTNDADTLHYRGKILYTLGRYEEALQSCDESLKICLDHAATQGLRGLILYELGQYEEVLRGIDKSLVICPNDAVTLHVRGIILYNLGRYEEALQSYDRSLEFRPSDVATLNDRGLVLYELDRYEEALQSYDESLKICPNDVDVLCNRALVLRKYVLDTPARNEEPPQNCATNFRL